MTVYAAPPGQDADELSDKRLRVGSPAAPDLLHSPQLRCNSGYVARLRIYYAQSDAGGVSCTWVWGACTSGDGANQRGIATQREAQGRRTGDTACATRSRRWRSDACSADVSLRSHRLATGCEPETSSARRASGPLFGIHALLFFTQLSATATKGGSRSLCQLQSTAVGRLRRVREAAGLRSLLPASICKELVQSWRRASGTKLRLEGELQESGSERTLRRNGDEATSAENPCCLGGVAFMATDAEPLYIRQRQANTGVCEVRFARPLVATSGNCNRFPLILNPPLILKLPPPKILGFRAHN